MADFLRKILLAGLVLLVAAGCATAPASAHPSGRAPSSADAGLPLPRAVAERLPDGVFYLLAGSDPTSYNLWEVSNTGSEVRLTHNNPGYGISSFGASPAGIVMSDAASGFDKLARLAAGGTDFLKKAYGGSPAINSAGKIAYQISDYNKNGGVLGSELRSMTSFTAPSRLAYQTKLQITELGWGPAGSIAMLTGSHYPGTKGPTPGIYVFDKSGKFSAIRTSIGPDLGSVVWNEAKGGIGVSTWSGKGEVIYSSSRRYILPAGWTPAAWNPPGTNLLVWGDKTQKIGLWSPANPKSIHVIGMLPTKLMIGEFIWLAKPAKR